jgi:hypothetical protein
MRTLILILATAASAWALDNAVTIYEASGSAQNNRPVTISRQFAEGEIAECAAAFVGGSPLTTQTDVRTRWSGGSLKHALITFKLSLTANGSAVVEFRNSPDCNNSGAMTLPQITAAAWDAGITASSNSVPYTVSAKDLLTALGSIGSDVETLGARYLMRGPLATQVIIEDRDPATRQADFGWEYDADISNWKAPTDSKFRTIHPMFTVTIYPDTPSSGNHAVRVEYIARSAWTDRMQTQYYDLTLTGTGGSTVYSTSNWRHIPKTAWRVIRWVANQPGAVTVDYNLRYLIYSKALHAYDLSLSPPLTYMDTQLNQYDSRVAVRGEASFCSETDANCMQWLKAMGTGGGRPDMGNTPGWYSKALFAMGNTSLSVTKRRDAFEKFIVGAGNAAAAFPFHYQEHLTDRCYVRPDGETVNKYAATGSCTKNAAGLPLSITARPTILTRRNNNEETTYSASAPEDRITYACTSASSPCQVPTSNTTSASNLMSWEAEGALGHLPEWFYVPYLLTGDYFFLEEMHYVTTFYMGIKVPMTASGINARDQSHGLQNQHNNPRASAWWMRTAGLAAVMSIDGTAAKDYVLQKLRNNIAMREGTIGLTNGIYYNDSVRGVHWTRGRDVIAGGKSNPLGFQDLNEPAICNQTINEGLKRNTCAGATGFMHSYFLHALGWLGELLPEALPLSRESGRMAAEQVTTTGYPAHMAAEFHHAVMGVDNSTYLTSWADVGTWAATRCYLANAVIASSTTMRCYSIGDSLNLQNGRHLKIEDEMIFYGAASSPAAYGVVIDSATDTATINGSEVHGYTANYAVTFTGTGRTVSSIDTGTGVITTTNAHGYPESHGVRFTVSSGGSLPDPLLANTTYYLLETTSSTFKLSATRGGSAISITSAGSGTISVAPQSTQYFIRSPSSGSFQLSMTSGGAAIDFQYNQTLTLPTANYDCNNGCTWTLTSVTRGQLDTTATSHAAGAQLDLQYWRFSDSNNNDPEHGYSHIIKSATAFGFNSRTGRQAWHWVEANTLRKDLQATAVQWAHAPREEIRNLTIEPGSSQILFRFTAPSGAACGIRLATSAPDSTLDSSDTVIAGGPPIRTYVASSLTPSTAYHYRLTCGTARVYGTVSSAASGGGGTTVPVMLKPPSARDIADAVISYGSTPALGSSVGPVACSTSCTVNVPATEGTALYYRAAYRNSSAVTVATGAVHSTIP